MLLPISTTILNRYHQSSKWIIHNKNGQGTAFHRIDFTLEWAWKQISSMQAKPLLNPGSQQKTPFPHWSPENFLAGKFQKLFETWLNETLPFRANMVRMFNQIYYDLFSKSYINNGNLVIGKNGQLNSISYINKYYNIKNEHFSRPEFVQWIDELQELSAFFSHRHQNFIYLITPSKAAYFPEYIPAQFSKASQPVRPDYTLITQLIKNTTISHVDTSKILLDAKNQSPVDLFPRGGIHWNMLGAALATKYLLIEINKNSPIHLEDLQFQYTVDRKPRGTDIDLITLANLWNPDTNYPVPHVKIKKLNDKLIKKPTIVLIGGSFIHQIREILIQSDAFSKIDYFNYFKIYHTSYPNVANYPVDENNPATYQEIFDADIVIVEENEQNLRSNHLSLLKDKLLPKKNARIEVNLTND